MSSVPRISASQAPRFNDPLYPNLLACSFTIPSALCAFLVEHWLFWAMWRHAEIYRVQTCLLEQHEQTIVQHCASLAARVIGCRDVRATSGRRTERRTSLVGFPLIDSAGTGSIILSSYSIDLRKGYNGKVKSKT